MMTQLLQLYRPEPARMRWTWLKVWGPDSQDFLHRISTANVKNLKPGEGTECCLLASSGEIEAAFMLWNTAPSEYAFEFDAGADGAWLQHVEAVVKRYIFSDKVSIGPLSDISSVWTFGAAEAKGLRPQTYVLPSGVRVCEHGNLQFERAWTVFFGNHEQLESLENSFRSKNKLNELTLEALEGWRVEALRPRLGFEIDGTTNPLELGMLEAVARNKGCYPGQEVMNRLFSSGALSQKLVKLECLERVPELGEAILSSEGIKVGRITSVSPSIVPGKFPALLGFINRTYLESAVEFWSSRSRAALKILKVARNA